MAVYNARMLRWGSILVVALCSLLAGYFMLQTQMPATSIADIAACAGRRDLVECARPHVHALLDSMSAEELIVEVEALQLSSNQCHYVLHLIGQELFGREGSVERAIGECTHACNSACPHGVIGEAFSDALAVDSDTEVVHLTSEEIRAMGKDLCDEPSGVLLSKAVKGTCHGAGHALLLAYQDIDAALDVCADIAVPLQESACYRGVYMEYTDLLSARSTWQGEYEDLHVPSTEELASLCLRDDTQESAACYYYLPIAVRQVYQHAGITSTREEAAERARDICLSIAEGTQRQACLLGYGVTLYGTFRADHEDATRTCLALERRDDQESCIAGMISLVVEYGENEEAVRYCATLTDASLETLCYGAVFERLVTLSGRSVDDAERFCPHDAAACTESASRARAGRLVRFFALTDPD